MSSIGRTQIFAEPTSLGWEKHFLHRLGRLSGQEMQRVQQRVDLLIVGGRSHEVPPVGMHITVLSEEILRERCERGDDFVQWALHFGRAIAGRREWARLRDQLLLTVRWPDPAPKVESAFKHLKAAEELLFMEDWEAAREEASFGLSRLTRFELLQRGEFPLSRPELPHQLRSIGQEKLASILARVMDDREIDPSTLWAAIEFLRDRLGALLESRSSS
jgi:hypothetical protein